MIILREKKFDEILYRRSPVFDQDPTLRRGYATQKEYLNIAAWEEMRRRDLERSHLRDLLENELEAGNSPNTKLRTRALDLRKAVLKESIDLRRKAGKGNVYIKYPDTSSPLIARHHAAATSAGESFRRSSENRIPSRSLTFKQRLGLAKDSLKYKYKKSKAKYIVPTPTRNREVKSIQEALERGLKTSAKHANWLRK